MSRFEAYFGRTMAAVAFVVTLASAFPALAETVEVAPGVQVTKRSYPAPTNEQPFFGFAAKDAEEKSADEKFVSAIIAAAGTREKAFDETTKRAWRALNTGKIREAAVRFNQAFLISPEESSVYHGFAVVAQFRFNDLDAADELFKIALKQPDPVKALRADYGRMLLIAKRPRDAEQVLEQAVKDAPDFGDAWTNLAVARYQNGNASAACAAVEEAFKRRPSNNSGQDLITVKNAAQCK
ncbi:tetratricopeptide repeat protein [Bradyrhizobium sp. WSM 1738]|uniref:tetratricopeptide repeat protein n=1 Tax=Bradyrhizobium hereditatis TaxID=2821405 RepID=UPI001CE27681|nr:tetratricopeptide repeat protein [Bradyrhizobium hereditatis]MCA6117162.1 tetratricopeptide repeat protein [Bradyrhizobium hereditatis]